MQEKINGVPMQYAVAALWQYLSQQSSKLKMRDANRQLSEKAMQFLSVQHEELEAIAPRITNEVSSVQNALNNANAFARIQNKITEELQDKAFTNLPEQMLIAATSLNHQTVHYVKSAVVRAYCQIDEKAI